MKLWRSREESDDRLDVLTQDSQWFSWSSESLARCADASILVINPVVYAEISIRFATIEELEDALPKGVFERREIPWEAAFLAGKCFMKYRRAGGARTAPLPDFFVVAHAVVEGLELLTRDKGKYPAYFPTVRLIAPNR